MAGNGSDALFSNRTGIIIAAIFMFAALILWSQGRIWWCPAGDWSPWAWDIWTQHNSQHLVDPYSFTHVLHGILEFWLITLVFGRWIPLRWRLVLAMGIEATWEVVENSAAVIEHYRAETISLNYFGDSIINSMSDITCCGIGFLLGYKLRFWKSALVFALTEIILIFTIHDSLIINIIMLLLPLPAVKEAIKHWQMSM